jgi:putative ATPase
MKELGYHEGYRYAHDYEGAYVAQEYLPDELAGARFFEPGTMGFENEIAKRLEWWRKRKEEG